MANKELLVLICLAALAGIAPIAYAFQQPPVLIYVASLKYQNWTVAPIENTLYTPLNSFTLTVNVTSKVPSVIFLNVSIDGYTWSSEVNLTNVNTTLLSIPFNIPYGNYTVALTAKALFNISKPNATYYWYNYSYRLIMFKPLITAARLVQCGLVNVLENGSSILAPYFKPLLLINAYSRMPVELVLYVTQGLSAILSNSSILINGESTAAVSLGMVNGSVGAYLMYNGSQISAYSLYTTFEEPWLNVVVKYGNAELTPTNGAVVNVVAGNLVEFLASSQANLTVEILVNGSPVQQFIQPNAGIYNVAALAKYGSCTVQGVEFAIRSYSLNSIYVKALNTTIAPALNSTVAIVLKLPPPIINGTYSLSLLSNQYDAWVYGSGMVNGSGVVLAKVYSLQPGPLPILLSLNLLDYGGFKYAYSTVIVVDVLKPSIEVLDSRVNVTYGSPVVVRFRLIAGNFTIPNQTLSYVLSSNGLEVASGVASTGPGGLGYVNLGMLDAGTYTLTILYSPSPLIYVLGQASIVVNRAPVSLYMEAASTLIYGNSTVVRIMVKPPINASIYVYANRTFIGSVQALDGLAEFKYKPPHAGLINLTAYYPGSLNYLPSVVSSAIIVEKAPCELVVNVTPMLRVGELLNITGFVKPPIGSILISLNGSGVVEALNHGQFSWSTYILNPGVYAVNVTWPGNADYLSCSRLTIVTAHRAIPAVYIAVSGYSTLAEGSTLTIVVHIIAPRGIDTLGNATLMYWVNGVYHSRNLTVGNGTVITVRLDRPGSWVIKLAYRGNRQLEGGESQQIVLNVPPGLYGLPWYIFAIYALAIVIGVSLGLALRIRPS